MALDALDDVKRANPRKGLVMVFTGNGKGKTTAALGMALRAWGQKMSVCVIQFIKSADRKTGEIRAAERMGVEVISSGDGFTWMSADLDESAARARHGWQIAQQKITSGQYDMVILDEMTYCFTLKWLDFDEVRQWLDDNKPPSLHVVVTGRGAGEALIDYADLVTEMKMVKHPYADQGIPAQPGVEY